MSCYKIAECLYRFGTDLPLTRTRRFVRAGIGNHRPAIGTCLAALSSAFPVAFLEPGVADHNPFSVSGSGFAKRSLEAQEAVARLAERVPELEMQLQEIERFVEEGKIHQEVSLKDVSQRTV